MLNRIPALSGALLLGALLLVPAAVLQPAMAAGNTPPGMGTALVPPQQQLEALERMRLAAIASGDSQALDVLLADDYVHVHGTGHVDDKAGFIKSIVERPRESTRGPLTFRFYGDVAIITGEQVNRSVNADKSVTSTTYIATQVARRVAGRWSLVSMQLTPRTAK